MFFIYRMSALGIMSTDTTVSTSFSRPKVHRLPESTRRPQKKPLVINPFHSSHSRRLMVKIGGMAAAVVFIGVLASYFPTDPARHLPSSVGEAGMISNAMASVNTEQNKTIILKDQNEGTVGQMAKMPDAPVPAGEVSSTSMVDNRSGRNLLSIINRY